MCAKWVENGANSVDILCKQLEKFKLFDNSGKMDGWQGFEFEHYLSAIESYLMLNDEIPDNDKYLILYNAITSSAKVGKLSAKGILANLCKEENNYLNKPKKSFILVTSISIKYFEGLEKIIQDKKHLKFSADLPKRFDRNKSVDEWIRLHKGQVSLNYTFTRILVNARNEYEAFNTAIDKLDLLRGILNLFLNEYLVLYTSYSPSKQLNKVTLGGLHTLHLMNGKLATELFWYEPDYLEKPIDLSQRWEELLKFTQNTEKILKKHIYKAEIEDSIRRYVRALDYKDLHISFLELWILLEKLTSTTNANYEKTVKRTAFLFEDVDLHKQVLQHLRLYRNSNVHSGQRSERIAKYVYQLKDYVERLLFFHIKNHFRLSNFEETATFLDLAIDTDLLKNRVALINKGIKFRSR